MVANMIDLSKILYPSSGFSSASLVNLAKLEEWQRKAGESKGKCLALFVAYK